MEDAREEGYEIEQWRVASSAKAWMGLVVRERRSLINKRNRVGASTEPCGTPAFTLRFSDRAPSIRTEMERSIRKLRIQETNPGGKPKAGSLASRPSCQTRSNAFEMSRETRCASPWLFVAEDQTCDT